MRREWTSVPARIAKAPRKTVRWLRRRPKRVGQADGGTRVEGAKGEYLARLWRANLDHELAEGCQANAAQSRQMAEEFAHAGAELP
jgi:hypothetical protein